MGKYREKLGLQISKVRYRWFLYSAVSSPLDLSKRFTLFKNEDERRKVVQGKSRTKVGIKLHKFAAV